MLHLHLQRLQPHHQGWDSSTCVPALLCRRLVGAAGSSGSWWWVGNVGCGCSGALLDSVGCTGGRSSTSGTPGRAECLSQGGFYLQIVLNNNNRLLRSLSCFQGFVFSYGEHLLFFTLRNGKGNLAPDSWQSILQSARALPYPRFTYVTITAELCLTKLRK